MLATLGLCFFVAPATAGFISSLRTGQPVDYVDTEIRHENSRDLQTYWKDHTDLIDWRGRRGVSILSRRVRGAQDRELMITMLDAPGICGIRECPVRIHDGSDQLVFETSACNQSSLHALVLDSDIFIACGVEHRIGQGIGQGIGHGRSGRATAASAVSTRRFWHNGSIVEASLSADNSVRIRYVEPRHGLPSDMQGLVMFEGRINRGHLTGTAYTFKTGCAPAPYQVDGLFGPANIVLAGASPARDPHSCAVTGYTSRSPNARLNFVDLTMANR
ncbi:MAG: hypothetical protein Q7U92_02560 [Bradyrhizobium sp.]|nr:hypothetical protein [Bradyrhizobium sp.]